jgi:DNA-binding NtrC family response regulator
MNTRIKILLVDDQLRDYPLLPRVLARHGIEVAGETHAARAIERLEADSEIDLVLLDLLFPDQPVQGEAVFADLRRQRPELPVIIFTSRDQISLARSFIKEGAADYFFKSPDGIDFEELAAQIDRVWRLAAQRRLLEHAAGGDEHLVGEGHALVKAKEEALRVAGSRDTNVLLTGESGVGKEVFARFIHRHSERAMKPFVVVSVPNLPADLLESELFGQYKGAFTGAIDRRGLLEDADGGTVLLDEIAELSPSLQPKLLRVLQDKEVRRVGGNVSRRLDVRFIFATNQDLSAMVADGSFREALYYRVSTYSIHIPPLRDHIEDVEALATHFLRRRSGREGASKTLSDDALEALRNYDFPGNVRELENLIASAVVRSEGAMIHAKDLHLPAGPSVLCGAVAGNSSGLRMEPLAAEILAGRRRFDQVELEIADHYQERQIADFLRLVRCLIRQWQLEHGRPPMLKDLAASVSPGRHMREAQRLSQIFSRARVTYAQLLEEAERGS